jgi:hypothetical protein
LNRRQGCASVFAYFCGSTAIVQRETVVCPLLFCCVLLKLFYLALRNISRKWTMPIRDWKAALTRFTIQFEDRMNSL